MPHTNLKLAESLPGEMPTLPETHVVAPFAEHTPPMATAVKLTPRAAFQVAENRMGDALGKLTHVASIGTNKTVSQVNKLKDMAGTALGIGFEARGL